jgi:hypothetical protein
LNSFVNFRLTMSDLRFRGHDLIFMSTKPAAGHLQYDGDLLTKGD